MSTQLAIQLYTLRDFCKTAADFAATMRKCRQIGYQAAQVSGIGPIPAAEVRKICDGEGITICASHCGVGDLRKDIQPVIDTCRAYGCKYTAIGGVFPTAEENARGLPLWTDFVQEYNGYAAKFRAAGVHLGYHNHSHELVKYDGVTILDHLWRGFSDDVWMEIDTYWITHGGGDPTAWIGKVSGRIPVVHLKDMAIKSDRGQYMAEVGIGNLNWSAILPACKAAGVQWYVVEQDTCYRDHFESIKSSYEFLTSMGLK